MRDSYITVRGKGEGCVTEKRSRFLSYALPVGTAEEAMDVVADFRRRFHDARHVCWAYVLGAERSDFRANDDGEPSSTAGRPILGQINARQLTDVLVVVVRYFGGVELGTGGLAVAYRVAAAEALDDAGTQERTVDETLTVTFAYPFLNAIMRIVKEEKPVLVSRHFEADCQITLRIRQGAAEHLKQRLLQIESATIKH
jgi:uncharacterized YigZ family protein